MDLDGLVRRAGPVMERAAGGSVRLDDPRVVKEGRRSRLVRCRTTGPGAPASILVKEAREEPGRGFSEWASLAFLSGFPEAAGIAPRFYGGDAVHRFFLLEDLGEGRCLGEILNGSDPGAIAAALRDLAVQTARLHAVTFGREERFEAIRSALPEAEGTDRREEARRWEAGREQLEEWFRALKAAPPVGFDICLRAIAAVYREPGDFLAFTQGDPAPSNNRFAGERAWLLDFEYGGFRHALYDITAWEVLCPLPRRRVEAMRSSFQGELAKAFHAARDEARFAEAWAALCAYRVLAMLTWISPDLLERNGEWADGWTRREAVFVALSRLERVAAPWARLEAVGRAAAVWLEALRKRWPEFGDAEALLPRWSGPV